MQWERSEELEIKGCIQHRSPDDDSVHQEGISGAQLGEQRGEGIDDPHIADTADHQKQTHQQSQCFKVDSLQGTCDSLQISAFGVAVDQADDQQGDADQAVGLSGHFKGQEGCRNQQHNGSRQQNGGNDVLDPGHLAGLMDSTLILAEGKHQHIGGKEDNSR